RVPASAVPCSSHCYGVAVQLCIVVVHRDAYAFFFFFFNDTATSEIYTLSLHDALPISSARARSCGRRWRSRHARWWWACRRPSRSEEHTSELQSQSNLVCRLLLEKKKKTINATLAVR